MTTTEQKTDELLKDSLGVAQAVKWQLQRANDYQNIIKTMEETVEEDDRYVHLALIGDHPVNSFPVDKQDFTEFLKEQKTKACVKSKTLAEKLNMTIRL